MAKPWARLEIGYLNHPKFLALTANAICLWHEGKAYCDTHYTDGLIPKDALKTFRFRGVKSVQMLLTTCSTPKPDGRPYAPLWEDHAIGYKMHDYLDHNDCRDEVLARLEGADERNELRKLRNRERQAAFRKRTQSMLDAGEYHPAPSRDPIDYAAILKRDGLVCHICGRAVGISEIHFDHVIPIVRGGDHSPDNIRVSHDRCNVRKSSKVTPSHASVTPVTQAPSETETQSETETPKEQKEKTPAASALLAVWNETVQSLPKCQAETDDRIKAAKARLRERPDLTWWRNVVVRMEASDFLTGVKPSPGHENWRADVDWFLKPGSAAKVMEGKYDTRRTKPAPVPDQPTTWVCPHIEHCSSRDHCKTALFLGKKALKAEAV